MTVSFFPFELRAEFACWSFSTIDAMAPKYEAHDGVLNEWAIACRGFAQQLRARVDYARRRLGSAALYCCAAFRHLGEADKDEQFADAITETLTTDLARIAHSAVIARNTAFTFKGKAVDARQIGKQLGVRYILEGSIQRSGDRIRVNVQLIDAESGHHLWADRFDKMSGDLLQVQDEIVARVANALNAPLIAAEAQRAERAAKPALMDLYFQGTAP